MHSVSNGLTRSDVTAVALLSLTLFDATHGFDTGLHTSLVVPVSGIALGAQEFLILFACLAGLLEPWRFYVLSRTVIGKCLLALLAMVTAWAVIRIINQDIRPSSLRIYFGWILVPVSCCLLFQRPRAFQRAFQVMVGGGFVALALMITAIILGRDVARRYLPELDPGLTRVSAHYGICGWSLKLIGIAYAYSCAQFIASCSLRRITLWGSIVFCFLVVDLCSSYRAMLFFHICFAGMGFFVVGPMWGIKQRRAAKITIGLTLLLGLGLLAEHVLLTRAGLAIEIGNRLRSTGVELRTRSESFKAHYLAPFTRLKMLQRRGLVALIFGAGPVKKDDVVLVYSGDTQTRIVRDDLRNPTSDSDLATLLSWYGLAGWLLVVVVSALCIRRAMQFRDLEFPVRYVLLLGSLTMPLFTLPVYCSNGLSSASFLLATAALCEYRMKQFVGPFVADPRAVLPKSRLVEFHAACR